MSDDSRITFYDILGVAEDATAEQIRAAYRKQARSAHPDMGGSAHAMRLLNKAFRVLKDPELRTKYDRTLHEPERRDNTQRQETPPPPPEAPREPSAAELIQQEKQAVAQVKAASKKVVLQGFGLIVLGIIITAIGYNMASPGSTYFVFWGLILWGAIAVFRGWYHTLNPYASLHKALDQPGQPYKFLLERKERRSWAVSVIILSCLGVFILIAILSSSGSNSSNSGTTANTAQSQTTSAPNTDGYGYPTAYSSNFTQSCINNGGTATGCACALNTVQTTYTYAQAAQIDASGTVPPDLSARISSACN